jgi:hypothetical protein
MPNFGSKSVSEIGAQADSEYENVLKEQGVGKYARLSSDKLGSINERFKKFHMNKIFYNFNTEIHA